MKVIDKKHEGGGGLAQPPLPLGMRKLHFAQFSTIPPTLQLSFSMFLGYIL